MDFCGSPTLAAKCATRMGHPADVEMPEGLPGTFVWKGKVTTLHPGTNSLQLK